MLGPRRPVGWKETAVGADVSRPHWWVFGLLVLSLKGMLLFLDPIPKLFLGDSGWYLLTAAQGVIPADRSFTYGYVIRLVTLWSDTLTPLLCLQTALSAASAILLAYGLHTYCTVATPVAFGSGLLCALEPLQLLYERYVIAETLSLFFFVVYLLSSLRYLRQPRLRALCLVQLLGIVTVSLRLSFLSVVLVNAAPALAGRWTCRPHAARSEHCSMTAR